MSDLVELLALSAGAVLVLGLVAGLIKNRLYLSEPLLCVVLGVVVGPHVLGWVELGFDSSTRDRVMQETARVTVAVAIMAAALRLPRGYLRRRWRELVLILTVGMLAMWAVSSLLAWLILPVSVLAAALIGAVITPTDPVLAHSIVTGRTAQQGVPGAMRHSLSAESAANDGLALLLVMLPLSLLTRPTGEALSHWLTKVLLWEVLFAAVVGALVGWLAGRAMRWASRRQYSEEVSLLTVSLALALTMLAVLAGIESDGLLGVFTAGAAFDYFTHDPQEVKKEHLEEAVGRFFLLPVFVLFGVLAPWPEILAHGWALGLFVVAILLLRRLPVWLLLGPRLPSLTARRQTLFNGWFGPIGAAALFYAAKAHHSSHIAMVWTAASAVVLASVLLHGISSTPLTQALARGQR